MRAKPQNDGAKKKPRGRRRNGEGSICQRPDGRWVAQLTTEGGQRKNLYGSTADAVLEKLARAQNQKLDHVPFTDERLTVGQWLSTWLRNVKPPATSPKTWVTYEGFVRLHLIPELGQIRLVRLQPQDVRDFLDERLDRGLSPRTVKHLRATLRAALNQAVNDELLQRNVAQKVKAPEVVSAALDVYTPEEARILLEAAKSHRLEALFTVAAGLALRKGECLGLQWSDIDFARGLVTIRHSLQRIKRVRRGDVVREGEAKTERLLGQPKGKKIHSLRLPGVVLEALERHRRTQQEERLLAGTCWRGKGQYVFTSLAGTPLEPRRLDRIFHEITREAGLRPLRFHDLRHSAAAILIAQGVHPKAIQELLRHSSIQLTMDTYGHLFEQVQRETADQMDAALRARPGQKEGPIDVKIDVKPVPVRVN
jgi:integrase